MAMRSVGRNPWCWAMVLLIVVCGGSGEVEQFRDTVASTTPVRLGATNTAPQASEADAKASNEVTPGNPGETMEDVKKEEQEDLDTTAAAQAEKAAEDAVDKAEESSEPALSAELQGKIQAYVKARMASPEVQDLIKAEVADFKKKNPGLLELAMETAKEPVTAEQAAQAEIERAVRGQMQTPAVQGEIKGEVDAAEAGEAAKIEEKVNLEKFTQEGVTLAAKSALKSASIDAYAHEKAAADKVHALSVAAKAVRAAPAKSKLDARLADAKQELKNAKQEENEASALKKRLPTLEKAAVEKAMSKDDKALRAAVAPQVEAAVSSKISLKAEEAADNKVQDIAENMQASVDQAVASEKLRQAKKKMLKVAKAQPEGKDNNAYWNRRRSFSAEKQYVMGQLDGWKAPEKAKMDRKKHEAEAQAELKKEQKEQAEQDKKEAEQDKSETAEIAKAALKKQIRKQITPTLTQAIAKAAIDNAVDIKPNSKVDTDKQAVVVAEDDVSVQRAIVADKAYQVDEGINTIALSRQNAQTALNAQQAIEARAATERSHKAVMKNKVMLDLDRQNLIKKEHTLSEAKTTLEKVEDSPMPDAVKKAAKKMTPDDILTAAHDAVKEMTKEPEPQPEPKVPAPQTEAQATASREDQLKKAEAAHVEAASATRLAQLNKAHAEENMTNARIQQQKTMADIQKQNPLANVQP